MVEKLKELIQKLSWRATIPTLWVINDLNEIIKLWESTPKTLLEEVQEQYEKIHWKIPNNKKNDIKRLTSHLSSLSSIHIPLSNGANI